jgi:hypothetical protein
MKGAEIQYLIASPAGDVPVDQSRLDFPLEGDLSGTTYRSYFRAIANFFVQSDFRPLREAISRSHIADTRPAALNAIIIRSEKHGALYHPASVECILPDGRIKFGLHVAVSDSGRTCLEREFAALNMLHSRIPLPYLPKPYHWQELNSVGFLLEEWFEDFHEFHAACAEDGDVKLTLWEYGRGNRVLTSEEGFEIYRQAAHILTLYYDINEFRLIYPWHHAAGDFIASIAPSADRRPAVEKISLRLTSARRYESFIGVDEDKLVHPALALFYFLLHLSIQMRLDRLDGVGEVHWADDSCVTATVAGFFGGLGRKPDFREACGSVESFLKLLQSFDRADLLKTSEPIVEQFVQTRDYAVIRGHLEEHIEKLYLTLRNFP